MTLNWSTNWSGIGAELAAAGLVLQLLQFFSALAEKGLETRELERTTSPQANWSGNWSGSRAEDIQWARPSGAG